MADGALIGTICYASQAAALDAYYSRVALSLTAGRTSYVSTFEKIADVWQLRRYQVDGSGMVWLLSESVAPVVVFPVCDTYASFKDGHMLGWGVVVAMIAAWCIVNLKRGL